MRLLLGEETHVEMHVNTDVASTDTEVTERSLVGKRLADLRVWEQYNVVITRIRRQGLELTPTGNSTLELGDTVRCRRAGIGGAVRRVGEPGAPAHRGDEHGAVPAGSGAWHPRRGNPFSVAERHCHTARRSRRRLPGQLIGRSFRTDRPIPTLCTRCGQESLAGVGSDALSGGWARPLAPPC